MVWYVTSAGLQLLLAYSKFWKFGIPWWHLPLSYWLPGVCLTAAFLVSAAIAAPRWTVSRGRRLLLAVVCTTAVYGVVFLGLFVMKSNYSRAIALAMFASAVVTVPAPYLVGASRWSRASGLCALIALAYVGPLFVNQSQDLSQAVGHKLTDPHSSALKKTAYYNLDMDTYSGPKSRVRGGALSRIGDSYLLLTGEGQLYLFGLETQKDRPGFKLLPYQVPINGEAFAAAGGRPWATAPAEGHEESEILNTEWFRTYGLLVTENGPDVRIFVSHVYWYATEKCWVERVSTLEADREAILHGAARADWKTLYETTPCLPVNGKYRRHGTPFVGYFGGGRMQLLGPQTLLLTVGDFGFDGVASIDMVSQDPAVSYGKVIAINIADGRATPFTLGNRNPQGLYIDRSGTIWSTEHGPQGGDELNRLTRGANYGWPLATYGTDYGSFFWPLNQPESAQQEFEAPVFAWVPSIGVSNLLVVEHGLFSRWRGDLLIASLKEQTLFRAHLNGGHLVYLESITIGS